MSTDTKTRINELTSRAAKGDQQAFGALYEQHLNQIYRYIFYRVNNEQDAEDLTEQTFLNAWNHLTEKKNVKIKNFQAWIYRIAHNIVVEHYRTKKAETSIDDVASAQDPAASPENLAEIHEDYAELAQTISQLELNLQQVLILRFINQMSHNEVAQIMNIKENHARILQFRALKKVRGLLDKEETEHE